MLLYVECRSSNECGPDEICLRGKCHCVGDNCPGIMIGFEILINNNRLCFTVEIINIFQIVGCSTNKDCKPGEICQDGKCKKGDSMPNIIFSQIMFVVICRMQKFKRMWS